MSVTHCQLDFASKLKWPCLSMLLDHGCMHEAEAMRFLHGVVDMTDLADKLTQKFPEDAGGLIEEVRLCVYVVRGRCSTVT